MKIYDKTNLVISGNWNLSILTPDWILTEFKDKFKVQKEVPVEFSFQLKSFRFTIDDIIIQPDVNRLNLYTKIEEESFYTKITEIAGGIVNKLPHTPITAVGHNISYQLENENFEFFNTDQIDDFEKKYKDKIGEIVFNSHKIKHAIEFEDHVLNLTYDINRQHKFIDFNYNYPIKDKNKIVDYINKFKENILNSKKIFNELME